MKILQSIKFAYQIGIPYRGSWFVRFQNRIRQEKLRKLACAVMCLTSIKAWKG